MKFKNISNLEHLLLIHFEMSLLCSKHLWRMHNKHKEVTDCVKSRNTRGHSSKMAKLPNQLCDNMWSNCLPAFFPFSKTSELETSKQIGGKPSSDWLTGQPLQMTNNGEKIKQTLRGSLTELCLISWVSPVIFFFLSVLITPGSNWRQEQHCQSRI